MAERRTTDPDDRAPKPAPSTQTPPSPQPAGTPEESGRPQPPSAPAPEPLEHDEAVDAVTEVIEEQRADSPRVAAEQIVTGHAAPLHPSNTLPREEQERRSHEAMGLLPKREDVAASADLGGSRSVRVESDEQQARRVERERAPTTGLVGTLAASAGGRSVTINGVCYVVPLGDDVSVPESVAEALENADRPLRTSQAAGEGSVPVVDLRPDPDEAAGEKPRRRSTGA